VLREGYHLGILQRLWQLTVSTNVNDSIVRLVQQDASIIGRGNQILDVNFLIGIVAAKGSMQVEPLVLIIVFLQLGLIEELVSSETISKIERKGRYWFAIFGRPNVVAQKGHVGRET